MKHIALTLLALAAMAATPETTLTADSWRQDIAAGMRSGIAWDYADDWIPTAGKATRRLRVDGVWFDADAAVDVTAHAEIATFVRLRLIAEPGRDSVRRWSRIEGIVRGDHPYALVFDDLEGDASVLDWAMPMPTETTVKTWDIQSGAGRAYQADLRLAEETSSEYARLQAARPFLLVRALQVQGKAGTFDRPGNLYGAAVNWPGYLGQVAVERPDDIRKHLFVPGDAAAPDFRLLLWPSDGASEVPQTFWQDNGRKLRVVFRNQEDEITFSETPEGLTAFTLVRKRGAHAEQVIAFDMPYTPPPPREKGELIGYWSFDRIQDGEVIDESGYDNHGRLFDAFPTPGIKGSGLDAVSVPGQEPGEVFTVTDSREKQPPITFGRMIIPGTCLNPVNGALTVSFWYSAPPLARNQVPAVYAHLEAQPRQDNKCLFTYGGDPHPDRRDEAWSQNLDIRLNQNWSGDGIYLNVVGNSRVLSMRGTPVPESWNWHHVAIAMVGKTVRYYLDARLVREETLKKNSLADLEKGEDIHVLDGAWARMDELRLHNYALSADEIKALYRADGLGLKTHFDFTTFERLAPNAEGWAPVHDTSGFAARVKGVQIAQEDGRRCLRFDGRKSQMQIPATVMQGQPIDGMSVAMWIRFDSLDNRTMIYSTNNHAREAMHVGHWGTRVWGLGGSSPGSLRVGRWQHVAVAFDNFFVRTYIDGELAGEREDYREHDKVIASEIMTLGATLDNPNQPTFSGCVADLQVFNYAITGDQVNALLAGQVVDRPVCHAEPKPEERIVITATR